MVDDPQDKADWQGVGDAFRSLGRRLKDHAVDAGSAVSAANKEAGPGAMDQVNAAFTTAVAKLDETTTDPEIGKATREATARLLDAIKAELTGGAPSETAAEPEPAGEPSPPKAIE
jgi:hypothetical protein